MASNLNDIEWTPGTVFITEIINTNQLPVLVKVAEGYYGNSDSESFSIGDLIKLDFVRSIQKVRATVLTKDRTDADEILIPLGYKGKVVVESSTSKDKSFHSVEHLKKVFPRFVRVAEAFQSKSTRWSEGKSIEVGEHLELDRYIEEMGLVCKNKTRNENIVISPEGKYHFISEQDNNEYTINEVIEHFPLPTTVVFVEDELQKIFTADLQDALENMYSFCGCLRLLEIMTEEVVIGHHKPLMVPGQAETIVQRNLIMLPTTREVVKELEVYLPIDTMDSTYELLLARNFSQKLNMAAIDGALYVEMAKKPMNMIPIKEEAVYEETDLNYKGTEPSPPSEIHTTDDKPPPIPPRSDPILRTPNSIPPRPDLPKPRHYEELIKSDDDDMAVYTTIDDTSNNSKDENKENSENSTKKSKKKHLKFHFKSMRSTKPDELTKKDKSSTKHALHTPKSGPKGTDYENSDMIMQGSSNSPPMSTTLQQESARNKPLPPVPAEPEYETLPVDELSRANLPMDMSVSELKENLQYCDLRALANLCQKNSLDGRFLFSLSDEQLGHKPYSLNAIQITKVRKMAQGWLPKK